LPEDLISFYGLGIEKEKFEKNTVIMKEREIEEKGEISKANDNCLIINEFLKRHYI
jgi:hypothetical protein